MHYWSSAALLLNKRRARSSSQHSDATGCPICSCCYLKNNLRLFAIQVEMMKFNMEIKLQNSIFILHVQLSEKKKFCHFSQHFNAIRWLLDLHKKFWINLSLFAIGLAEIKSFVTKLWLMYIYLDSKQTWIYFKLSTWTLNYVMREAWRDVWNCTWPLRVAILRSTGPP